MKIIDPSILQKAKAWTEAPFDEKTRTEVSMLFEDNLRELEDAFYRDLEFGTGGLRGIMGPGTNRMNRYTVAMATQGLANYLKKSFPGEQIKSAIAYDCRNNNTVFAQVTADVLTANGIYVYLFDDLRPTPELSFAIRKLGCHSGIVVTASHNPKEYSGYKVYWNDGAQLVAPHDHNVIREVQAISNLADVNMEGNPALQEIIGMDIDTAYIQQMADGSLSPDSVARHAQMKIVYTPIHGTGVHLVPMALHAFGFKNIIHVPEQDVVSGDFPTVHSPNPEEPAALTLALAKAEETRASLVMATDPDSDRVGIAVRNRRGEMELLNGNQTAAILIYYLLHQWKENGLLSGKEFIVKTIVTTELLKDIAEDHGVHIFNTLTGFKYIAEIIRLNEGKMKFIGGGEESYGYLIGDQVRDKDAVASCCFIAEAAAWALDQGMSLYELLMHIYKRYGLYLERLLSITRKGKEGAEEIQAMMTRFRLNPPLTLNGSQVIRMVDYHTDRDMDMLHGSIQSTGLPTSDVLQFFTAAGDTITIRPSGTEPKIKFYFGVKGAIGANEDPETVIHRLDNHIALIRKDMGLD